MSCLNGQLLPCTQLAIVDTLLLQTGAEVRGIRTTENNSHYYGLSLPQTPNLGPDGVCYKQSQLSLGWLAFTLINSNLHGSSCKFLNHVGTQHKLTQAGLSIVFHCKTALKWPFCHLLLPCKYMANQQTCLDFQLHLARA